MEMEEGWKEGLGGAIWICLLARRPGGRRSDGRDPIPHDKLNSLRVLSRYNDLPTNSSSGSWCTYRISILLSHNISTMEISSPKLTTPGVWWGAAGATSRIS